MSTKSTSHNSISQSSFARLISVGMSSRLLVDTGFKIFNPFLPIIAAGLNTTVVVMGQLVGLRSAMGLLSPLFGALADRHGFLPVMRLGLLAMAIAAFLIGISTTVGFAVVGIVFWGIGIASFTPTFQAYLSEQLPYEYRARWIGIVEYSWALASIIVLPIFGWLIGITNWRMPFFLLSGGLALAALVFGTLPRVHIKQKIPNKESELEHGPEQLHDKPAGLWMRTYRFFDLGANNRSTYSAILVLTFSFFASAQLMLSYGAWLAQEYGFSSIQLGTAALWFGVADLGGSILVSVATDRLGKKRSVFGGLFGSAISYGMLPFLNVGVASVIFGISLARFCFEFTVVSGIPLLSEQVPNQRGKVLTLGSAINLLGFTLAGFTGPWLYTRYGIETLTVVSTIVVVVGLVMLQTQVNERGQEHNPAS